MLVFIETRLFSRLLHRYLSEEECASLQRDLYLRPRSGRVIPGAGGLRKLRWARRGGGKQGGLRIIYFPRLDCGEVWMLTIYAKNEATDLPLHILRKIREEIDG